MNRIPVLLDMDPGVDDALAILLAMRSPELDVRAITICGGNVSAERCALNALKTLDVLGGSAPPVALGAWRPLRRSPVLRGSRVHGDDGLGNISDRYPDPDRRRIDPRHAVDLILETARTFPPGTTTVENAGLTIIATGPLTNIALAISKDPGAIRRVQQIVWMGGSFGAPGNVTPVAEFNAYCDPDAAAEVFSFDIPIMAVGLNVTHRCALPRARLRQVLDESPGPVSRFAWDLSQEYMDFHLKYEQLDSCYLHDPAAVAIAIWPDLATEVVARHVEVVTDPGTTWGMTITDERPRSPWINQLCLEAVRRMDATDRDTLGSFGILPSEPVSRVVLSLDSGQFLERFLERIRS